MFQNPSSLSCLGISSVAARGLDLRPRGPKNAKSAVAATRIMRREIDTMGHSGLTARVLAIRDIRKSLTAEDPDGESPLLEQKCPNKRKSCSRVLLPLGEGGAKRRMRVNILLQI